MADVDTKPKVLGGTAIKPKERHGWEAVRYIIHNPETGEYFTRTPKSWLLITGFYIVYYSCLAGFWAAMLNIFFLTLDDNQPKWLNANSLIGESPGLGLKPIQVDELIDSSMIAFNHQSKVDQGKPGDGSYVSGTGGWVERTTKFLAPYKNCTFKDPEQNQPNKPEDRDCFDTSLLGACKDEPYGYGTGQPCVFLKLNKIYGLKNTAYDTAALPADMPQPLKDHIPGQADKDQVWVECHGEYPADKEALGAVNYFPSSQGFPGKAFPYTNQKNYQSPLIAVQFANAAHNQLLHIECRAWAQNIGYNKRDRIGINHLELLILDNKSAPNIGS